MANVTSTAPSTLADDSHVLKTEQNTRLMYNRRPADLEGPPITIYAPPFARIKERVKNLDTVYHEQNAVNMLETTGLTCLAARKFYNSEREREDAVYLILRRFLGVEFISLEPLSHDDGRKWSGIDGIAYTDVTALPANSEELLVSIPN